LEKETPKSREEENWPAGLHKKTERKKEEEVYYTGSVKDGAAS